MPNTRLLLVEDDRALADLVTFHFERSGYDVTRTGDGEEALILVDEVKPDVILLDWMIEGISGIEVCRRLRRRATTANVPIMMLTARGEESDRIRGFETGADDYVTKPFSPRELVARVRAVFRRVDGAREPADVITSGDVTLDRPTLRVSIGPRAIEVTPTEFELLATLARQPGRVFTRAQLLDAIRGADAEAFDRAIDAHVKNLRRKIERDPRRPRYLLTVHGVGYKFAE